MFKTTRKVIMRKSLPGLAVLFVSGTAFAQTMPAPVNVGDLKWGPGPPALPPGAQLAVISGDPSKEGTYVVRLKLPASYKIAAHHHSMAEYITVLSGTLHFGMGDKLEMEKGSALQAGGFVENPAKMNHYVWTTGETMLQVSGQGPFDITYVNPVDDPTKK
jgi:quercetin dioxygenase-like cupin family protein